LDNIMDKATYDRGLKIRKGVLGDEFIDKAIASADDFNPADAGPHHGILLGLCLGPRRPDAQDAPSSI
jgi:hypothetical protein